MWITFILLISALAQANNPVFTSGDWYLYDSDPNHKNRGTCVAQTAGYFGAEVYSLNVVVDKTGVRPLEILVQPNRGSSPATAFQTILRSGSRTWYFARLPEGTARVPTFWHVPENTDEFLGEIRASNQMHLYAVSGSREVLPLSMAGSTATTNELFKRCGSNTVNTKEFEKAFLPENNDRFDIRSIEPSRAAQLRATLVTAVVSFRKVAAIETELRQLNAQFAQLIKERETLQAEIGSLRDKEIPSLYGRKADAETKIERANSEINDLQQQIMGKTAELTTAQEGAKAAQDAIAPYRPEFQRLTADLNRSTSERDRALGDLRALEQNIRQRESDISRLERESDSLYGQLAPLQEEVRDGRQQLQQAEDYRRSFDPQREFTIRYRQHPRVGQLEQETDQLRSQLQSLNFQRDRALRLRDQRAQELRQCQINGGGPQPPVVPATCSAQELALQQAERELQQIQSQLNQVQSTLNGRESELQTIRQQIQYQVGQETQRLDQSVMEWRRYVQDREWELSRVNDRLSNIQRFELPRARADLDRFQRQLGGAQDNLAQKEQALAGATEALDRFKASVNYDQLQSEVDRTNAIVRGIEQTLASLRAGVSARQTIVRDQTALRDSLAKQIQSSEALLAAKIIRLADVNSALASYDQKKAEIMDRLQLARQELKIISDTYARHLGI
jgi:chromosome segregation ATPase